MSKVEGTRKVIGITILVGTAFFFLNSISDVVSSPTVSGILILIVGSLIGYYIGQVIVLKNKFIPEQIKIRLKRMLNT